MFENWGKRRGEAIIANLASHTRLPTTAGKELNPALNKSVFT